jgi:hypothetical protein
MAEMPDFPEIRQRNSLPVAQGWLASGDGPGCLHLFTRARLHQFLNDDILHFVSSIVFKPISAEYLWPFS